MAPNETHDAREVTAPDAGRPDGDPEVVETSEFADLQTEVDAVSLEELLTDPDYLEFLDGFGSLDMPEDEDLSLDELVELEPDGGAADADSSSSTADRSPVVDALIRALESEAVSEAQRAELRAALGLQTRHSTEVQLNYLKSRFLDLEAYLQTMEAFFDQRQTPLEELEAQREALAGLRDDVDSLSDRLAAVQADLETVTSQQAAHGEQLTALEQSLERTHTVLRRNLDAIETELARSNRWRQRVREAVQEPDRRPSDGEPSDAPD